MLLFQFPGIAERWLTEDNWHNFRTWGGHPDADQVVSELEATGSLTPGLNWYRANVPPESWVSPPLQLPPVQAPVMGVWSTGDPALTEAQMTDSAENVAGPWRYERLEGPGHWMQLDAPDQVNALLTDFLPAGVRPDGEPETFMQDDRGASTCVPDSTGPRRTTSAPGRFVRLSCSMT